MKNLKILIAEDDRISFEYLKEVLRIRNADILLAKTGKQAVDMVNSNKDIDLVLMDIKMPEMDGREATKRIKTLRPELPVIAQTAYAMDDERETILKDGFDAYLAKPIQRNEIISIIEKALN